MAIIYNPSSLTAGMSVKYITKTSAAPTNVPFIFAYPSGQTLAELSPSGAIAGPPANNTSNITTTAPWS